MNFDGESFFDPRRKGFLEKQVDSFLGAAIGAVMAMECADAAAKARIEQEELRFDHDWRADAMARRIQSFEKDAAK